MAELTCDICQVKELVQADTEVFKSRAVLQELKTGYLKVRCVPVCACCVRAWCALLMLCLTACLNLSVERPFTATGEGGVRAVAAARRRGGGAHRWPAGEEGPLLRVSPVQLSRN